MELSAAVIDVMQKERQEKNTQKTYLHRNDGYNNKTFYLREWFLTLCGAWISMVYEKARIKCLIKLERYSRVTKIAATYDGYGYRCGAREKQNNKT